MSDDPETARKRTAIHFIMRGLDGFAHELGLDEATMRLQAGAVAGAA